MTRFGDRRPGGLARRQWHWRALLPPLLAAALCGLFPRLSWLAAASAAALAALAVLRPGLTARLAPYAVAAYGAYGLFFGSWLAQSSAGAGLSGPASPAQLAIGPRWGVPAFGGHRQTVIYGVLRAGPSHHSIWVLPEACVILAAAAWLLAVSDVPGRGALRHAAAQLRGAGQSRTVPPLLLVPVIALWEELLGRRMWFTGPSFSNIAGPAWSVMLLAAGLALAAWLPRAAATAAAFGTVLLGLAGLLLSLRLTLPSVTGSVSWFAIVCYGPLTLHGRYYDGLAPGAGGHPVPAADVLQLAGLEGPLVLSLTAALGLAVLAYGALLASRLPASPGASGLPGEDELPGYGELAVVARALSQRVTQLAQTRSDATETAVAELRRIERDLHDGAQARLIGVGLSLRAAEQLMPVNPEAALALVAEARETSSRALDDLRDLVRGIYPPVLADRGLSDAVRALALDIPLTVHTDIDLPREPPVPVAAAAYFAVAEALTNAARHADADTADVTLTYCGGMLRATVTDDGHGGADPAQGTGLAGVERRLATFDGILAVTSPAGGPTIVAIEIPYRPARGVLGGYVPARGGLAEVVRSSWQTRTLI